MVYVAHCISIFVDCLFLKDTSHDLGFQIYFLTLFLILLQFRGYSYELNLFTKEVLQNWHILCKRAKHLQFQRSYLFAGHKLISAPRMNHAKISFSFIISAHLQGFYCLFYVCFLASKDNGFPEEQKS